MQTTTHLLFYMHFTLHCIERPRISIAATPVSLPCPRTYLTHKQCVGYKRHSYSSIRVLPYATSENTASDVCKIFNSSALRGKNKKVIIIYIQQSHFLHLNTSKNACVCVRVGMQSLQLKNGNKCVKKEFYAFAALLLAHSQFYASGKFTIFYIHP